MPPASIKYPSNQIRRYRRLRGLKLRQLAAMTGMKTASHFAHWEKGRKLPSLKNALKLSAAIQCPVEVLFSSLFNQIRADIFHRREALKIKLTYE